MKKMSIMDKKQVISKEIFVDMFKHKYDIFIGDREPCIKAISSKYNITNDEDTFPPNCDGECLTLSNTDFAALCVVWVSEPNIEYISHELDHAVTEALGISGITQGPKNQEVHAYYLGWMIKQVFQFLYKKGVAPCV